ncbi:hypothetical protein MWH25_08020 [Natroniella acetigena]|uniref:hypothetical protein n=1 Tax=Natroniella acetigena TaxID=52004 RepID=UPI00200BA0B1|nr:hypothetical protein [Natroniella acetigena]MCK8827688.1 hypothetical protein [Natroniella acetigena]
MKIVFLCPVVSHVRYHKRINALKNLGANTKVLAFEREYYSGKSLSEGYVSLGEISHGNYFKRIIPFIKSFSKIRSMIKNADIVYAFGLDNLLLGWLANSTVKNNSKIIYEVGDIRGILLKNSFSAKLLRELEKFLLNHINLLVVTSKAYISGYYEGILNMDNIKYQVIENKLNKDEFQSLKSSGSCISKETLKIGYFGVLRCQRSWNILKKVAEKSNGRIQIYLRGIPMGIKNFKNEVSKISNVNYGGPYKAPDDLFQIYNQVDIVWACYPYQDKQIGNWLWARTNRFYESCLFNKPMLTLAGNQDAKVVNKFKIGKSLDLSNIKATVKEVLNLDKSRIKQWEKNLYNLPEKLYLYTNEHKKLFEFLNK